MPSHPITAVRVLPPVQTFSEVGAVLQTWRVILGCFLLVGLSGMVDPLPAAPPTTIPPQGIRRATPAVHALVGGRIVISPGRVLESGVLVIRDGVIVAVGADIKPPADAQIWDASGKTIYPGLLDAYSPVSLPSSAALGSAPYWNDRIRPEARVAALYKADEAANKKLRSQGVTSMLAAPSSGIIKGVSAVVTTDGKASRAIVNQDVALHMRLTVSRGGRDQYPNSPMGAVALARQAMYDAAWHRDAWSAHRSDSQTPPPERNDALAALVGYAGGDKLVVIDANDEQYLLRADRFAREFALRIVLRDNGHAYRRLAAVRALGRPMIVPVNFPKPPNVATWEASRNVTLEDLMHWDHAPENPARLHAVGIKIAFTSAGLADRGKFLQSVRAAVERGLPAEAALAALTTNSAELLGVASQLGTLERGKLACFFLTDGDLFNKKTKVFETWVRGVRYEIKKAPPLDVRGVWQVALSGKGPKKFFLDLSGEPGKLKGEVRLTLEKKKGEEEKAEEKKTEEKKEGEKKEEKQERKTKKETEAKLKKVALRDSQLSCTFPSKLFGKPGLARLSVVVSRADDNQRWIGAIVFPNGLRAELTATRKKPFETSGGEDKKKDEDDDGKEDKSPQPASFAVNFPLGARGRKAPPEQPQRIAFTHATVWTCGPQGILEDATVLVQHGLITAVGKSVVIPKGATIVDASGKHISPGIIDCHSHMATDGGVNESGQAITAEVRIGDFIDAADIAIYQQLAGGVTTSNILHGSANPIGGQNQVIKLRWGALPEEMKFKQAPQGVKFALGENVKQSNWGDKYTTRYPQTRMGVEQIMRDAFTAAKEYRRRWADWKENRTGLPPRVDLEQQAIAEILSGSRWIHCHSYRQDEILALIRTLDDFGVQIGTFQHILEGYKVADAMAKHGAMGSSFSDWWAYKLEVYDAIPYNGALMHKAGVVVSFNSDDRELARHLNQEAAKAVKYGGVSPEEALKFVTLNPAKQLRIEKYVGSLEAGKQADLVLWSGDPLSNFSRCEQTWIDGRRYFDRGEDLRLRLQDAQSRAALIQKIIDSGQAMRKEGQSPHRLRDLWPRFDEFCGHHDHDHDH